MSKSLFRLWPVALIAIVAFHPLQARAQSTGTRAQAAGAATVNFADLAKAEAANPKARTDQGERPPLNERRSTSGSLRGADQRVFPTEISEIMAPGVPSPAPTVSFQGLTDTAANTAYPPDTDGAVGLNEVMEGINRVYQIQAKTNGAIISTLSMATFWAGTGASGPFDPKTLYDPINNRWIVVVLSNPTSTNSSICVGVSQTSDPNGTYILRRIVASTGMSGTNAIWADFPNVGFNRNWIAINVNMIGGGGSRMLVVDYPQLRAGTLNSTFIDAGPSFCSAPVATYTANENTLYVITHVSGPLGLYRVDTITGTPGAPVYNAGIPRLRGVTWAEFEDNVLPQAPPVSGTSFCGTTPCPIESQDSEIRNSPVLRDGFIYYAQTIGLPTVGANHTAIQWTKLVVATGDVSDGGRVEDPTATANNGGKWYSYPHIAVNKYGDMILGFSQFSSVQYPSAGYTYHDRSDGPGVMRDPYIYKVGVDYHHQTFPGSRNRWGDYSKAQVDPSNDIDLWVIQEYGEARTGTDDSEGTDNDSVWGTWWAEVRDQYAPVITIPGDVHVADTCVGETNYATFYICNTGKGDLQIGPITSSSSQFAVLAPSSGYPVTVSPDFCFPFRVRFSPFSSGDKQTTFTIPSNDPNSATNTIQGFGKGVGPVVAAFIATNGDFGEVCVGGFRDLNLTINNAGGCTLKITNISSSSGQFLVPTVLSYPIVVHPGDSVALPIRFQPTSLGSKLGAIMISSDDPLSPKLVSVSGNAPPGDVRVTGSTDFGEVCAGGPTAEKTISVCNVGKCNLLVTNVSFNPPCADFTLINNPFPAVVSHDSCVDVVIRYTPTSCGTKHCTLVIRTDDPDTPVISLNVTASTPCGSIDVPPDMAFPPTVINTFGPCRSLLPFPISNTGPCPLWITDVKLSGPQAAEYSFVGLPSFPIILEQGHIVGEGDLSIAFAPGVLARERHATITVTYITDPVAGTTASVTRELCGEGVQTGARVLVMQGNIPLAKVEKIQLQRINANRNKDPLDTHDVIQDAVLVTSVPGSPCEAFQYHREYGTVSNPIQLLPGSYQVTVSAIINGKRKARTVGFNVDTCDFNPAVVIKY